MVISECSSIRIGSINARREIPNIKSLDANDTPLIDQSMIFLAQLSQLVYLNIGGTFVTSSGYKISANKQYFIDISIAISLLYLFFILDF